MAILTVRPDGDNYNSGTTTPTSNRYQQWDEVGAHDGDSSYNRFMTSYNWGRVISTVTPSAEQNWIISSIKVYAVLREETSTYTSNRVTIRVNGTIYPGDHHSISTSYVTKTQTWTTNPASGQPWTPDDINGDSAYPLNGIGISCFTEYFWTRVTQVYAEITYTIAPIEMACASDGSSTAVASLGVIRGLSGSSAGASTAGAEVGRYIGSANYIDIYPDADITTSQYTKVPDTGSHYEKVNEEGSHDGDTSYIWGHSPTNGWGIFMLGYDGSAIGGALPDSATITNIIETLIIKRDIVMGTVQHHNRIQVDGTAYNHGSIYTDYHDDWRTKARTWTTNPKSSAAWTVADIKQTGSYDLEGMGIYSYSDTVSNCCCTQAWIRVNFVEYTLAPVELSGQSDGTSTNTVPINITMGFAGTTDGTSTAGGDIPGIIRGLIANSAGTCTANGHAHLSMTFDGASDGASEAANTPIKLSMTFGGSSDGSSTAGASTNILLELIGTTNGISTATAIANITKTWTAGSGGVSTVAALTKLLMTFDGAANGIATAGSLIELLIPLDGYAHGSCTTDLLINILRTFAGATDGLSTASASIETRTEVSGASNGGSTVGASLETRTELGGQSNGTSTASCDWESRTILTMASAGTSTASATMYTLIGLTGQTDGSSTAGASFNLTMELAGGSDGTSTAGMAVQVGRLMILRVVPVADISNTGHFTFGQPIPPSNYWSKLDEPEEGGDEDSSYIVQTSSNEDEYIFFDIEDINIRSNTRLHHMEAHHIARAFVGDTHCHMKFKVNGTWYESDEHIVSPDGYTSHEHDMTINPDTSLKWTIDDLNGDGPNPLEGIGVGGYTFGANIRHSTLHYDIQYFLDDVDVAGQSDGSSTADALFQLLMTLAGASDGSSTAGALINLVMELAGASDGTSTAGAVLETRTEVEGASAGTSLAGASIETRTELGGQSDGVSTATCDWESHTLLAGQADGLSTAGMLLGVLRGLSGAGDGTSTAGSFLERIRGLIGSSDGWSNAGATTNITKELVGNTNGIASAGSLIKLTMELSGASNGVATTAALLDLLGQLAGISAGTSTAGATFKLTMKLAGVVNAISTAGALLGVIRPLAGVSDGTSTAGSLLMRTRGVIGSAAGSSTGEATINLTMKLGGTVAGTSTAGLTLDKIPQRQQGSIIDDTNLPGSGSVTPSTSGSGSSETGKGSSSSNTTGKGGITIIMPDD